MRAPEASLAVREPMVPFPYRVAERVEETRDTATLVLEPVDAPQPEPEPGQFHMLWSFGVGEAPISVSGIDPAGGVAHTVRAVGRVTAALAAAEGGAVVGVRGPYGAGWDTASAEGHDLLVVAGGIGLAPLRPVLQQVLRTRDRYGRVALLVGAREPRALLYRSELEAARAAGVQVEVTVDRAASGWDGDVGVVTDLVARVDVDPRRAVAMVCGPEIMMRRSVESLLELGIAAGDVSVSLERNMQCAIGTCGHCQLGPAFVCTDGPVLAWPRVEASLAVRER